MTVVPRFNGDSWSAQCPKCGSKDASSFRRGLVHSDDRVPPRMAEGESACEVLAVSDKSLRAIEDAFLHYDRESFEAMVRDRRGSRDKDLEVIDDMMSKAGAMTSSPAVLKAAIEGVGKRLDEMLSRPQWSPVMLTGTPDRRGLLARTELAAMLLDTLLPGTFVGEADCIEEARRCLERAAAMMRRDAD